MYLIAEEGPLKGQTLSFEEGEEWILGRDPASSFVIDDKEISKKQARITKTGEGLFLQNLSRAHPTLINGLPAAKRQRLNDGDKVQMGASVFAFSDAPEKIAAAPKKKAGGYDDIFGDLEKPELPPEPEPVEEAMPEPEAAAEEAPEEPPPAEKEIAKTAYDTIFEDIGAPSEMPFNLAAPEPPLILKVIGGPNAGAEIGLDKGRTYLIGKDPATCDIVFQDLSVSRNHARLTVTPEGIVELEDLGSKNGTLVNNVPAPEKRTISMQDTVAMGTTIFLILDREAAQETIFTPKAPLYEAPKAPEAPAEEAVREKPKTVNWKEQKIPSKHLIMAGSFVVIFLIMFLSFFSLFKAEHLEVAVKAPEEHIKEALAKFGGVTYSFNPASGKLFLSGHVLSAVDSQEMHYNLAQIPVITSTDDNVVIDEYVWKSMTDVLTSNSGWRGINIVAPEPGKFLVHGYVQTTDQAGLLADYLNVNFPYPDRLQNKVIVEDTLNLQILSLLQAKGFGGVAFALTVGDLVLSGRYSQKQESEYKDLLADINKLPGIQSVKNFAVPSLPSQASIDLTQQYKVTGSSMEGGRGYSAVINGRIFTIGQALDGMKISSIEQNQILLEKDGLKYKIDYTR